MLMCGDYLVCVLDSYFVLCGVLIRWCGVGVDPFCKDCCEANLGRLS